MNSYKYFENRDCKYYPCHETKGEKGLNCLFCYCPLYHLDNCPGNPSFIEKTGRQIKVCTACTFPHEEENYEKIVRMLSALNASECNSSDDIS